MLTIRNIDKSFSGQEVLSNISFFAKKGDKIALIGPNGVGKSTLLRIIAGLEEADSGEIKFDEKERVVYLPQEISLQDNAITLLDYLKKSSKLLSIEQRIAQLESQLENPEALDTYYDLQEKFTNRGGLDFVPKARRVLAKMGLGDLEDSRTVNSLSGGQKSKLMVASVLLSNADYILLDEPTNNLDLKTIVWLEKFIAESDASFLIVSHDRIFVDKIVDRVIEIDWYTRTSTEFSGGYTSYLEYRHDLVAKRESAYEAQREEIERLEKSAQQNRSWAAAGRYQKTSDNDKYIRGAQRDRAAKTASRAVSRERQIEKMPKIDRIRQCDPLIIPLISKENERDSAFILSGVVAGYPNGFHSKPISLEIMTGSRIGILGQNGSGKSTILRTMTGDIRPVSGDVKTASGVIVGEMMQGHEDLPRDVTIMHLFQGETQLEKEQIYNLLARFHFLPEDTEKEIGLLSPGERARVLLAKFAALGANILVLDEPTNHLDVDAMDALVNVLDDYTGTVIFVSHDRYFLEQVKADKLYLLKDGKMREISGLEEYLDE